MIQNAHWVKDDTRHSSQPPLALHRPTWHWPSNSIGPCRSSQSFSWCFGPQTEMFQEFPRSQDGGNAKHIQTHVFTIENGPIFGTCRQIRFLQDAREVDFKLQTDEGMDVLITSFTNKRLQDYKLLDMLSKYILFILFPCGVAQCWQMWKGLERVG